MSAQSHEAAIEKHAENAFSEWVDSIETMRSIVARHMRSLLAEVATPAPPQPAPELTSGVPAQTPDEATGYRKTDCDDRWHHTFSKPGLVILDVYKNGEIALLVRNGEKVVTIECSPEAPAPTPTDVSAAVREAAEKEIQSFLCEGDQGNPEWTPTGTHIEALLSAHRATDRTFAPAAAQWILTAIEREKKKDEALKVAMNALRMAKVSPHYVSVLANAYDRITELLKTP